TIVMFGGARIPEPAKKDQARTKTLAELSEQYDEARTFARLMTEKSMATGGRENVIVTGGGPGVMEAGNRGAVDAGGRSIGLNIVLPHEQAPNAYVTPELCFNFHYFAIRKMHFLMRARAICVFPGGFGTLDELFETLTLIQTKRMDPVPVLLFGRAFWERIVNWEALADAGTISDEDLDLFRFVETAEEAIAALDL
ncbi:MAG: TIGR00730 family Rossman fold protein, partial [Pseudomonadota bacterium]